MNKNGAPMKPEKLDNCFGLFTVSTQFFSYFYVYNYYHTCLFNNIITVKKEMLGVHQWDSKSSTPKKYIMRYSYVNKVLSSLI